MSAACTCQCAAEAMRDMAVKTLRGSTTAPMLLRRAANQVAALPIPACRCARPKGWKLVPLNPTPAMIEAADAEHGSWRRQPTTVLRHTWIYHAMIIAAPEPTP